jgi:hypothetical protein
VQQFLVMNLGPRLNQALLCAWKTATDALDRTEAKYGLELLVHRMEVRPVMRYADLREHADYDPEETRDLGHGVLYIVSGAHQRLDLPETDAALRGNQVIRLERGTLSIRREPVIQAQPTAARP